MTRTYKHQMIREYRNRGRRAYLPFLFGVDCARASYYTALHNLRRSVRALRDIEATRQAVNIMGRP